MKNPTSRMILNAIIKSLIFALVFFFLKSCSVKASGSYVMFDSHKFPTNDFIYSPGGNKLFTYYALSGDDLVTIDSYEKGAFSYYMATFCSDVSEVTAYYNSGASENVATFNAYVSNVPCTFLNGYKAHIVYFWGQSDPRYGTGSSNTFDPYAKFTFYGESASWQLLLLQSSTTSIDIDLTTGGIISQNQEIIDQNKSIIEQNQTLINQNDQIINGQKDVKDSIDKVDDTMKNDDVDSPDTSKWSGVNASDGPISNMVLMPITLLNAYINGINGSCTSFNLGNLYGTDIIFPCIDISNYLGSTLWNIIDVLFSGFMIFMIGKKFVKIFNDFTNLKDNQVDELYGGGN